MGLLSGKACVVVEHWSGKDLLYRPERTVSKVLRARLKEGTFPTIQRPQFQDVKLELLDEAQESIVERVEFKSDEILS